MQIFPASCTTSTSRSLRLLALACAFFLTGPVYAFGLDEVGEVAQALAARDFQEVPDDLPKELRELSYDGYRDIRFLPDRALWRKEGLPFELMFFHRGKFATGRVGLYEVSEEGVRPIRYDRDDFDFGRNHLFSDAWGDLGIAGFRVHAALNSAQYKDELIVFLGASYFRALGAGQLYGLSARALAIDTVGAAAEEFPRFTTFWVERPAMGAHELVVYALLDSRRATGAYRFIVRPGKETVVDVQARLYLREGVATLGLAPLTSMFAHGAIQPRASDFRPQVHDSDGLSIAIGEGADGGEWLWRPLINPPNVLVTSFATNQLRGFGLMQRERDFAQYQDTEALYQRRPSVWIAPQGEWGAGRVELVQLPTPDETNDNIVAYWVPARAPAPGQPLEFSYRMHWQGEEQQRPPNGWTVQSRRGHGFVAQGQPDPREVQYVIDFDGPALRALPDAASPEAVISASANARVLESNVYRNAVTGSWRMTMRIDRFPSLQPVELRAFLQFATHVLTETWTSILPAD